MISLFYQYQKQRTMAIFLWLLAAAKAAGVLGTAKGTVVAFGGKALLGHVAVSHAAVGHALAGHVVASHAVASHAAVGHVVTGKLVAAKAAAAKAAVGKLAITAASNQAHYLVVLGHNVGAKTLALQAKHALAQGIIQVQVASPSWWGSLICWIKTYHTTWWFSSIQCSVFYGLGDLSAQTIEIYYQRFSTVRPDWIPVDDREPRQYDLKRTGRRMAWGLAAGPVLNCWYTMLDGWNACNIEMINSALKVAADQLLFTPLFLFSFLFSQELAKTGSLDDAKQKVYNDLLGIWGGNILFWSPVAWINYTYIENHLLFMNSFGLFWDGVVSYWAELNRAVEV